jgi:hypothetical protein
MFYTSLYQQICSHKMFIIIQTFINIIIAKPKNDFSLGKFYPGAISMKIQFLIDARLGVFVSEQLLKINDQVQN